MKVPPDKMAERVEELAVNMVEWGRDTYKWEDIGLQGMGGGRGADPVAERCHRGR